MRSPRADIRIWLVAVLLTPAIGAVGYAQADPAEEEAPKKITREVIVTCDEGEDCAEGSHQMVWIGDGSHGDHFAVHSSFSGKGGYLGVQLTGLTPELRTHFGVPYDVGVMVAKVLDDTAAFKSGLAVGDIITRVDGEPVASPRELAMTIRGREEGDTVDLEIWRNGSIESIAATLEEHESLAFGHHAVVVKCGDDDEDCECTVNGEAVDCERLHREHMLED